MRVLVVEDESRMAEVLKKGLSEEGHVVTIAGTGPEALALARTNPFEVLILDIMLPGLDGCKVTRMLRSEGNQTPILMLTARDQRREVVTGLDAGADDYLTKPFAFEELLARVRAVGRRAPIPQSVVLRVADLTLDTGAHTVARQGHAIALTRREYTLLELLMRHSGRVVSRDTILGSIWGLDADVEANTVEAFVSLLRSKVDQAFSPKLIHTVRGAGYTMRESPE